MKHAEHAKRCHDILQKTIVKSLRRVWKRAISVRERSEKRLGSAGEVSKKCSTNVRYEKCLPGDWELPEKNDSCLDISDTLAKRFSTPSRKPSQAPTERWRQLSYTLQNNQCEHFLKFMYPRQMAAVKVFEMLSSKVWSVWGRFGKCCLRSGW